MVLVDTCVWVEHFRRAEPGLRKLLAEPVVLMHPFVLGELACGNFKDRPALLAYLSALPRAKTATDEESLSLVERRKLWGRGIGWIDVHLLGSALLSGARLWTIDERLKRVAQELGCSCL